MKKSQIVVFMVFVLMLMLVGCELSPLSKPLVVVNDSDADITAVYINEYVVSPRRTWPNALLDGEVIAPGASKTFYLAPYSSTYPDGLVSLNINEIAGVDFSFDFIIDNHNPRILATYDGVGITLSGSNVTPLVT